MRSAKMIIALAVFVFVLLASASAQSLEKRHQVGVRLGMWNQTTGVRTEIGFDGVTTSVGADGPVGGVFYSHWLQENLAVDFSIGSMGIDIETSIDASGVTSETGFVSQILMGIKYYPLKSTYASSVRPFVKASVGPFIGSQNTVEVGSVVLTDSRTQMAAGGRLDVGADIILNRHFMLGAAFGYNLMTDFEEPIGGSKNYSGPELSFAFGYLFGRGAQ